MGVFKRPDSKYWWLYLETTHERAKTEILVGETTAQRKDSKALALDLYYKKMNTLAAQVHHLLPSQVPERFDHYAVVYARDTIARHRGKERESRLLGHLVAFFGRDQLSAMDRARVKAYMTARVEAGVGANTVNREVDLLKAMLRDAVPTYLASSPLRGMKKLDIIKTKKRLLYPDEEARLLALAQKDPQDYALLVLGIDTLVRLGNLLDLRKADRRGLWITVPQTKNGDPLEVPLTPRAATALNALTHDDPYYFAKFRRAKNPDHWRTIVKNRLQCLCAQTTPPIPFGQLHGGITFHGATRKTGATRLIVERKVPVPVAQAIGGWRRPDVLLAIYTEAQRQDLLEAVGQTKRGVSIHAPFTRRTKVVKFRQK